jgi:hypothetical protein
VLKKLESWITIGVGVVLSLLSWSLSENVKAFKSQMDSMQNDVRNAAAQATTHTTQIAVIDNRVDTLEARVVGLESRERDEHGPATLAAHR